MQTSSWDDAEDCKVRKRRQQKRDYATRKRLHDKQLRDSLEMQHRELSGRSRRQRQQISQLKAWATYARSYLSLCHQLLAFRPALPSPPSLPEGGPRACPQTDAAPVAGRLEGPPHLSEEPNSPAEWACVGEASSSSSEDPEDTAAWSPKTPAARGVTSSSSLQVLWADQLLASGFVAALLTDDLMEDGVYLDCSLTNVDPFPSPFPVLSEDCVTQVSMDQTFIA